MYIRGIGVDSWNRGYVERISAIDTAGIYYDGKRRFRIPLWSIGKISNGRMCSMFLFWWEYLFRCERFDFVTHAIIVCIFFFSGKYVFPGFLLVRVHVLMSQIHRLIKKL